MNLPQRKATRLKEYDYGTLGAYFITFCTKNRTLNKARFCFHLSSIILHTSLTLHMLKAYFLSRLLLSHK